MIFFPELFIHMLILAIILGKDKYLDVSFKKI